MKVTIITKDRAALSFQLSTYGNIGPGQEWAAGQRGVGANVMPSFQGIKEFLDNAETVDVNFSMPTDEKTLVRNLLEMRRELKSVRMGVL